MVEPCSVPGFFYALFERIEFVLIVFMKLYEIYEIRTFYGTRMFYE